MPVQQTYSTAPASAQKSSWYSPVPYLFGGIAVMMGLIAFALLFLACSYWKLSRRLQTDGDADGDIEAGDVKPDNNKTPVVFEEKYLVIMAGEQKPTFLATPSSTRTSSFGSNCCRSCSTTASSAEELSMTEKEKDESSDQVQVSSMGSHVAADHVS